MRKERAMTKAPELQQSLNKGVSNKSVPASIAVGEPCVLWFSSALLVLLHMKAVLVSF